MPTKPSFASELRVNDSITLSGFTPAMFAYKLGNRPGNRSALDWVVEWYRVSAMRSRGWKATPIATGTSDVFWI